MFGLLNIAFIPFLVHSSSNSTGYKATFAMPFEISFNKINEFTFNTQHKHHFINLTSSFFSVHRDNITISFIRQISGNTYIDVGFTVNVNTFSQENSIKNEDKDKYRSYLNSQNNLPNIIGIEKKWEDKSCSPEKYATFYHYDAECQWLCDPLSIYDVNTNECKSTKNMPSTIDVIEDNQPRFIGYGYITAVFITICSIFGYLGKTKWYPRYREQIHVKFVKFSRLLTPKSEYRSPEPEDDENENENEEEEENVDVAQVKLEEAENENKDANLRKIEDEECNDDINEKSKINQNDIKTKGEE